VRRKPASPYNQPLSQKPISVAGKAGIAVAGFVWGLYRSLREPGKAAEKDFEKDRAAGIPAAVDLRLTLLDTRMARIQAAVDQLSEAAGLRAKQDETRQKQVWVTREELNEALDLAARRMQISVAEQFGHQMLAIGSLRAMIADTDALLNRVLDRLESSARYSDQRDSDREDRLVTLESGD
jgi:hypothetical protein